MFVSEGGFDIAFGKGGERGVVCCRGDGGCGYYVGGWEVGLQGLEKGGKEIEGRVVLRWTRAVGVVDSLFISSDDGE